MVANFRGYCMKRFFYYAVLFVAMAVLSACGGPRHMIIKENSSLNIKTIKPSRGKAALVVARTTGFGGGVEFDTFLDKKMIGVTKGKGYFIKKDVPPGIRYVISKAENMEPIRIKFEPNRVYYLLQIPRTGAWRARISVAPLTPDTLLSSWDDGVKLTEYDTKNPGEDLSDADYKQAIADYEREVQEGLHKEDAKYRGIQAR
jgi:hypothetical protein